MNREERRRLEKKKKSKSKSKRIADGKIRFVCLQCKVEEDIPEEVVEYCDAMDDGDITVPPRFACENCGDGEMVPLKYKGIHGIEY